MRRTALLVSLLLIMTFFRTTAANAQGVLTDEQGRALAIDQVAKVTTIPKAVLNTKRLEDLEDDLFSFQMKILGQIRKGAYFYRVEDGGWHITSPAEVTYSSHSSHVWYVAISTTDHEVFGLLGFKEPNASFQQLVSKIPVQVRNASEAISFARFFLKAVYGKSDNIVYDELRLRHNVEEHFIGYADSQEPVAIKEQRFRKWWNRFKAKSVGPLQPSVVVVAANRYEVRMKILEMAVGLAPELWQWSVQVQGNGMARVLAKQPILPTPSKKVGQDSQPTAMTH